MAESILLDVAAGAPDAVAACLQRFSAPVWSLARRMLRDTHEAEDAVQEVFLELWRTAGRYDPAAGSELTFVLTIARRRFIDRNRRLRRAPQPVDEVADVAAVAEADVAAIQDDYARVSGALDRLRPEQRTVIEMAYLDGQTHQEISTSTGLPLGTVKSHARRGLTRVREILGIPPDPAAPERSA